MKSNGIDIYDEAEFNSWVKKINIISSKNSYCEMIEKHKCEMENRKKIEKNRYLEYMPLSVKLALAGEPCSYLNINRRNAIVLSINTSEKTRIKAYNFINNFISCISQIGGSVYVEWMENDDNTMFKLLGSRYKCNLYEKQVKVRNKIKIEERKMSPLYQLEYSGELYFEIFEEKKDKDVNDNWELLQNIKIYDSNNLENELKDLFSKLRSDAIYKKSIIDQEIAKQEEERQKRIKEREEDKIREEQANIEKEKLIKKQEIQEEIKKHMCKLEEIEKALTYTNGLRSIQVSSDNERNLILKYCDYVEKLYSKSEFYKEILEFSEKLEVER